MRSGELDERVNEDFESAITSGVNGTPAFFVDGEPYDGAYDADGLAEAIMARA
jgi:protein-disulfide isomerase